MVTGTPNYPEGKIYSGYEGKNHRDEIINGVQVHRCPIHPRKKGVLHRFWNYYSFVFASKRYLSILKKDFDVVFVNQLSPVMMAEGALQWAKKHKKRCVLYCLDLWPESLIAGGIHTGSLIYKIFLVISKRIYRSADCICMTSQGFASYFQNVLEIPLSKLSYLPQYAEAQFDTLPVALRKEGTYRVLFAGNVGEFQSVETIIKAAEQLKHCDYIHFDIVGDGTALEKCRQLGEGLSNITFYGRKDLSEMPDFYARADIMVVTLKRDPVISGTLPGKVQSYLAAGKPIVGAIDGEAQTVIQRAQCGLCGSAEDADTLARNILEMTADPDRLVQWGINARKYYQARFSKDSFIDALERYLK